MRLDKDDPGLMDYVLGELDDGEAQTVAAALEEEVNKEARDFVEELRGVADTARRILHEEGPVGALRDEQRAAIVGQAEEATKNVVQAPRRWSSRITLPKLAAAAALLLVCGAILSPNLARTPLSQDLALRTASTQTDASQNESVVLIDAGNDPYGASGSGGSTATRGPRSLGGRAAQDNWTTVETDSGTMYSSGFPGIAGSEEVTQSSEDIVEARNRLGFKANLKDGISLTYESDAGEGEGRTRSVSTPEAEPQEEHWAEYNVGNLTGQTGLPDRVASHMPDEILPLEGNLAAGKAWQWNTPDANPTEIVGGPGTETYVKVAGVKPFLETKAEPLSTFSIDVDTAAYSNVRRFLNQGQLPPPDAVRIEEMINYFPYAYPQPTDGRPFAVAVHGAPAPWNENYRLVRIGVKGQEVHRSERPAANLVFLIDVSGSMGSANRLPLVKESMKTLLNQLRPDDRVAIVTYAGEAQNVLAPTPCSERAAIARAIDALRAGGSTNGGGGIQMAYDLAGANFNPEGINRVIMATDGDFNVGVTSHADLMAMIEARAKSGVFLTALGFGMGNLKDATLEQLANRGNGNYAYIDTHAEARRALVEQLSGTLQTIAKDVKIQVEFNPALVSHYRLIGYENRALANRDFNDDAKDAGEIGAGHTVTALYEIIPRGAGAAPGVDPLKYQSTGPEVDPLKYGGDEVPAGEDRPATAPEATGEWLTVKMRYKEPLGNESTRLDVALRHVNSDLREADADFRFAAAVAAFGQVLRNPGYRHASNFDRILDLARPATGGDHERESFLDLVVTAKTLCEGHGSRPHVQR